MTLLIFDYPLVASVALMASINLEVFNIVYIPVFVAYAMCSIVKCSPSAYIVKQVDYIVWKVIFLVLNMTLVNLAIWWPLIAKKDREQRGEEGA